MRSARPNPRPTTPGRPRPRPFGPLMVAVAIVALSLVGLPVHAGSPPSGSSVSGSQRAALATQVVALRALANGRWVSAENGGSAPLIANRTAIGAWERFDLAVLSGDSVALRAQANGRYVCADAAGALPLISNRDAVGSWETFTLIRNVDGTISLRAQANDRIVTAESAGAAPLIANRTAIGPWEKFDLVTQTATPPPAAGDKPGSSNTGPGDPTALRPASGRTVTTAGTVLSNLDISGPITIAASGVRIQQSRIRGTSSYGVLVRSGSVVIEDTEISGFENAIAGDNWSATRVDIHSTYGDGVKFGSQVTLQDSWIHDLDGGPGAHSDGGQMQSGVTNLVVRHNTIDMSNSHPANAALFLAPDLGPSTNGPVTIADNWLDGGNYILFCVDGGNGRYFVRNISITNNKFGRNFQYGPANINVSITQYGNVWADTGRPLSLS